MKIASSKRIKNGGFEQGILEIMNAEGLASKKDRERLEYLKSLPQDRTEILTVYDIKENNK